MSDSLSAVNAKRFYLPPPHSIPLLQGPNNYGNIYL